MRVPWLTKYLERNRLALAASAPVLLNSNAIGDRLLSLPAVRALASLFPGRLTLLGQSWDAELYYSDLPLRAFHLCGIHSKPTRQFDPRALARRLEGCDLFISLNTWHTKGIDEVLASVPGTLSLGFYWWFSKRFSRSQHQHACDAYFQFPRWLSPSLRLEDFSQPPPLPASAMEEARALRGNLPSGARLLAVHTEPSVDTKRWPMERFRHVLDTFLERHPEFLVLVVDYEESGLESIRHGDRVLSCAGASLPLAMALVGTADLFLGIDSCMLHVADFFRVPSVGLFGPTSPTFYGFRFCPHRHVTGRGQMEGIDRDAVSHALESVLKT